MGEIGLHRRLSQGAESGDDSGEFGGLVSAGDPAGRLVAKQRIRNPVDQTIGSQVQVIPQRFGQFRALWPRQPWPATTCRCKTTTGERPSRSCPDLPVEILGGSLDRLLPPGHPSAMSALLPDADLTIAEGAGHVLPLERPELVSEAIIRVVDAVLADGYAHNGQDRRPLVDGYAHNGQVRDPDPTVMRITVKK